MRSSSLAYHHGGSEVAVPSADAPARSRSYSVTSLASLESALATGLQDEWRGLVNADPLASLFQASAWCMPWYRAYGGVFDPYVIVVTAGGRTVGIVPMAVKRETREFVFAGDTMAGYRDIVALPDSREEVAAELIRHYLDGNFAKTLQVGWIDPASDTPSLLAKVCAERGLRWTARHERCWRWFPPVPVEPGVQQSLNWYQRNGHVTFDVIDSQPAWEAFREEYYRQQTLRQIQAGRQTAFDDGRKRALYEALFHSTEVRPHVTAFCLDGHMLAGHFGYVWRGVLLLGSPSIRLKDEQRSPAVILLSWLVQNAARLGLRGFDLTSGESDFKERLGNQCVELTTVEIHRSAGSYHLQSARNAGLSAAKRVVERAAGPGTWEKRVVPACAWLGYKRERLAEMGVVEALGTAAGEAVATAYDRRTGRVYWMTAEQLKPASPVLNSGDSIEFHDDRVEDLLLWNGTSRHTASLLTHCARLFSGVTSSGRVFHTVVVNGRLAGWGYSYEPTEPAQLTETPGHVLEFEPGAVSLYDFQVLPEFRGRRLYQALLTDILRKRFAGGASRAYITVLEWNTPSRTAIERVGFRLMRRNFYRRLFTRRSLTTMRIQEP